MDKGRKQARWRRVMLCALLLSLLCVLTSVAYASSGTIKVSNASCEKGKSASVTITIKGDAVIGGYDFYLEYDAKVLEYESGADGGGNGRLRFQYAETDLAANKKEYSITVKFKGKAVGSSNLTIKDYEVYNQDAADGGDYMSITASAGKFTVNAPYEASKNALLSSLKVGEGSLSPAFAKETYNYTMSVGGGVDSLTVSAKAADAKAKVVVSGNKALIEGSNTVTVKVTAEDGKTTKTYTITVTRGKPSPTPTPTPGVSVDTGDGNLTVLDTITVETPEGFEAGTMEYEGYTIATLQSLAGNVTLVQLSDDKLYVYEEASGAFYPYEEGQEAARSYVFLQIPEGTTVPEGYTEAVRTVLSKELTVYVESEESEYYLVYAMNGDGEKGWYTYDSVEGSMQRFVEEDEDADAPIVPPESNLSVTPTVTPEPTQPDGTPSTPIDGDEGKQELDTKTLILYALLGLLFVLTVLFLILFLVEKNKNADEYDVDDDHFMLDVGFEDRLPGGSDIRRSISEKEEFNAKAQDYARMLEAESESIQSLLDRQARNRSWIQKAEQDAVDAEKNLKVLQAELDDLEDLL